MTTVYGSAVLKPVRSLAAEANELALGQLGGSAVAAQAIAEHKQDRDYLLRDLIHKLGDIERYRPQLLAVEISAAEEPSFSYSFRDPNPPENTMTFTIVKLPLVGNVGDVVMVEVDEQRGIMRQLSIASEARLEDVTKEAHE